jgi:hypothetical protein
LWFPSPAVCDFSDGEFSSAIQHSQRIGLPVLILLQVVKFSWQRPTKQTVRTQGAPSSCTCAGAYRSRGIVTGLSSRRMSPSKNLL